MEVWGTIHALFSLLRNAGILAFDTPIGVKSPHKLASKSRSIISPRIEPPRDLNYISAYMTPTCNQMDPQYPDALSYLWAQRRNVRHNLKRGQVFPLFSQKLRGFNSSHLSCRILILYEKPSEVFLSKAKECWLCKTYIEGQKCRGSPPTKIKTRIKKWGIC